MSTPTTCPTCGSQVTDVDDERAEEEAPASTFGQMVNRQVRQRNTNAPLADLFTRGRRPDGDEAA